MLITILIGVIVAACTASALLSIGAVWHITNSRRAPLTRVTLPISVLKPLCGADDSLEANLETFFAQRYPNFELIFGVEDEADPAVIVVRRLMERHPSVQARIVAHGRQGLNPKVANLRGIISAGTHDLVVISDSNIAVGPDYLARLASRFTQSRPGTPEPGLVTSLFAGTGARAWGALLESLQLNGPVAGGIASSEVLSHGFAVLVGKSMMFRRSLFEQLGGMESLSSVLAEDYVMGRMFKEAGYQVRVCADVIHNVTVHTSVKSFLSRQLRWGMLRSRIKPLLYPFEILINPTAVALIALLMGSGQWVIAWALLLTAARDGLQWWRLRGAAGVAAITLGAAKDFLMIATWAAAPFITTVSWRGHRLRVSAGTRVYAVAERSQQQERPNAAEPLQRKQSVTWVSPVPLRPPLSL
jgi:ceramide glucosyltransferase